MEKRFIKIGGLETTDLSIFPLAEENGLQINTNKNKSEVFGEVFTPLWLVDYMLLKLAGNPLSVGKKIYFSENPLDLCSGYGQFTLRMLRAAAFYKREMKKGFDVKDWLKKHTFVEIQPENAYRIIFIFGPEINLFIGGATLLEKPQKGIFFHNSKEWVPLKKLPKELKNDTEEYDYGLERKFAANIAKLQETTVSRQMSLFDLM